MNHTLLSTIVTVALLGASQLSHADNAIIIGGGYNLTASQGQIELNVQYAKDTLEANGLEVTTYFTDGNDPGNDVFIQHENPLDNTFDALSRVFGDHLEQNREYRSHKLLEVTGSTQKELLLPQLENQLATANEPLWIIYNGHGQQSKKNTPDRVTLELWNNTSITANELHTTLKQSKQPIRYAFTQCYSGGFHSIAYEQPHNSLIPAKPQRCGFTAVSAYSLAEGCSASINTNDYRDYTTHFFAALSGQERNGDVILNDPDEDKNGTVSPREAHFYTLINAKSTDLSWSTSEDFLDRWEPWYLKWTPQAKTLPDNEYTELFKTLAETIDIPHDNPSVGNIRERISTLNSEHNKLTQQLHQQAQSIRKLRRSIAEPIVAKWPALMAPFSTGFQALSQKDQLMQFGSETDIATYEDFVACEELPMSHASE